MGSWIMALGPGYYLATKARATSSSSDGTPLVRSKSEARGWATKAAAEAEIGRAAPHFFRVGKKSHAARVERRDAVKSVFLLIMPYPDGRLGYAWANSITPAVARSVDEALGYGAKLVAVDDERWKTSANKIGATRPRFSVPKAGSDSERLLRGAFGPKRLAR